MSSTPRLRQSVASTTAMIWIPVLFGVTLGLLWWSGALQKSFHDSYLPHGFCFNWNPRLMLIHVSSDVVIALSYLSISATLAALVFRARGAIPFSWIFLAFGGFIVACGATHLMEVVTLWMPFYWLSGNVKTLTAVASLATALALPPMVPRILEVVRAANLSEIREKQLEHAQEVLQNELATRGETLEKLVADIAAKTRDLEDSRRYLYLTLKSIGDGVIVTDARGRVTFLNDMAEKLTGWPLSEAAGMDLGSVFRIMDASTRAPIESAAPVANRSQAADTLLQHTLLIRRDGQEISIETSSAPIVGEDGGLTGTILTFRDISDRRNAEETRRLLASIVDSSDDAVISRDLAGTITSWNRGAERLYGYRAEEAIGKPIETILPEDEHDLAQREMGSFRSGKQHLESKRKAKDGRVLDVSLTYSEIYDYTGRQVGTATIGRDITAQKQTQEMLRTQEKLAATGRLAATIAHEINNPLEAVMNLLYLIADESRGQDRVHEFANKAQEEMHRVAHITRQTLAFYRDSTKPVRVDLADSINSLLEIYRRETEDKGIETRMDVEKELSVVGLPGELRQVFANLIRNAIEAMNSHGSLEVTGRTIDGERVEVVVRDNGTGISDANKQHIFEPFFTTKGVNGTGLGLWVTQGIVQKHGGSITLQSPPEGRTEGAEFTVVLPKGAAG